ncbi:DUF397 domain-containing protein [Actinomadura sp. 7K507]|uniref:DUF397 domain-containing protein n=1 Tax=Actinomadura sp. 7K507 TaxID=2530365 RepID=UPI001053C848|nr:DUF397 domain-containing protein [Actinomadura sp. 7K507]TDC81627.1 DUF397 domain-containing protein [Actinomadura sp. 7K507]
MSTSDVSNTQWRKSSRSAHQGGECVEVAALAPAVAVRDSKDPDGPRLAFGAAAWRVFADRVKASEFDLTWLTGRDGSSRHRADL